MLSNSLEYLKVAVALETGLRFGTSVEYPVTWWNSFSGTFVRASHLSFATLAEDLERHRLAGWSWRTLNSRRDGRLAFRMGSSRTCRWLSALTFYR